MYASVEPATQGVAVPGYAVIPIQVPLSWQPEQPVLVLACMSAGDGLSVKKPLGVALVPVTTKSPAGAALPWQASQDAMVGICEEMPGAAEEGITTIFGLPAKLDPLIP